MRYLTVIIFVASAVLKIKADFCPEPLEDVDCDKCSDKCTSDRDCEPGTSCCREKCGNVCRDTPDVNKGTPSKGWSCGYCPAGMKSECENQPCKDECGPTLFCANDQPCCKTRCGNKCHPQSQQPRGRKAERIFCERQAMGKMMGAMMGS